jgi:hypothetical protein
MQSVSRGAITSCRKLFERDKKETVLLLNEVVENQKTNFAVTCICLMLVAVLI